MDTDGAHQANRSSPSCLNSGTQRTDFCHGLLWQHFLTSTYVTYVQGEDPNPADSGLTFARKARQVLGIPEERIVDPERALAFLSTNPNQSVMLLDDFVGSGNQMIDTWHRPYGTTPGHTATFADIARSGPNLCFVPIIATQYGLTRIQSQCPGLTVCPAHVLDDRYSLTASDSILWPDALKSGALSFIFETSKRAGIVDDYKYGWEGFHNLALGLALSGSVPDATLPLFFWDKNGWAPLISKR